MADPLKIDDLLARARLLKGNGKPWLRNRIYRVGVELEGGWTKLPDGAQIVHDGSVHITLPRKPEHTQLEVQYAQEMAMATTQRDATAIRQRFQAAIGQAQPLAVGELPSTILELGKWQPWMKQHYPQLVNESCGLHVHMSFTTALNYSKLMIEEYPATMRAYLVKWANDEKVAPKHPIWPRLRGESEYCQWVFDPDTQAARTKKEFDRHAKGHRYTAINFCKNTHDTIECRVLPMMETADQAISAVQRVIDITNACLALQSKKEPKLQAGIEVNLESDRYRDTHREVI